jgi:acyl-CoA reductase-like NAD-dependent aldehyde dehydrogenase
MLHRNYIGGEWVESTTTNRNINSSNLDDVVGEYPLADATAGVDYHTPFGDRKGFSFRPREQGDYAREFYTTVKVAYTLG